MDLNGIMNGIKLPELPKMGAPAGPETKRPVEQPSIFSKKQTPPPVGEEPPKAEGEKKKLEVFG